jgi:hypothetical protein
MSWFLGTPAPVIGLVQIGPASMADRHAGLPLIGLLPTITWDELVEARTSGGGRPTPTESGKLQSRAGFSQAANLGCPRGLTQPKDRCRFGPTDSSIHLQLRVIEKTDFKQQLAR